MSEEVLREIREHCQDGKIAMDATFRTRQTDPERHGGRSEVRRARRRA
jgi:hypothetical protein